jgi:hypothetical protein
MMSKLRIKIYTTPNVLFFYDRPVRLIKLLYFHVLALFVSFWAIFCEIHAIHQVIYYIYYFQWNPIIDGKAVFLIFSLGYVMLLLDVIGMYVYFLFECYKVITVYINQKFIRIDTWFGILHWKQQFLLSNKLQVTLEHDDKFDQIRQNIIFIRDAPRYYKWNIPELDEACYIINEIKKFLANCNCCDDPQAILLSQNQIQTNQPNKM